MMCLHIRDAGMWLLLSTATAFLCSCVTPKEPPPELYDPSDPRIPHVRVATFNVMYGEKATLQQIGDMFGPYELDIIAFCEVPGNEWTEKVGKVLGMRYAYVGKVASANHVDKYKSILSRTLLRGQREVELKGSGWAPASVVRAETRVRGLDVAVYSVHIPGAGELRNSKAEYLADIILPFDQAERIILMGDFNNRLGDETIDRIESKGMHAIWRDLAIDVARASTFHLPHEGVIDHIFYNRKSGAKTVDGGIIELDPWLSDHKPVWAEIRYPGPD
jgi:endonuclease/exonuclease/phosphatase family metal-dependent hydrolase